VTAGVLSVPSALRDLVTGTYTLVTEQDHPVGSVTLKGSAMWGVGPYFRRWGVEEGDFVVVTLNLNERRATIASGTEELLLRYQEAE
jgi:hypothetical protein